MPYFADKTYRREMVFGYSGFIPSSYNTIGKKHIDPMLSKDEGTRFESEAEVDWSEKKGISHFRT